MKVLIEVRPGEGGTDAKLLVHEQLAIYQNYATRHTLRATIEDQGRL